jgi:geranylgeranyl diphosphate synthase type I
MGYPPYFQLKRQESSPLDGEAILNQHLEMVDNEIKALFGKRKFPERLYDMMKYHLGWLNEELKPIDQYRGKRFRPTLCLLTYNALSGVYDKALPAAAAIELIHNFSLIHDDIEDMDEERRHKPTVWKLWGIPHAINVGDGMHVMANLAALRLKDRNVTSSKIVDVLEILNNTIIELCEGQYLDMEFEKRKDVTLDMYMDMISRKTAALIEASTHIGAILATNNSEIIKHFRVFGRKIGIAFQIVDDILGIWQKAEKTGKPHASDIRNRKKTLPILYAFEKAERDDRARLTEIYSKENLEEQDIAEVLRILERVDAQKYSQKIADKYEKEALQELDKTNIENDVMGKLKTLTHFLVYRTY